MALPAILRMILPLLAGYGGSQVAPALLRKLAVSKLLGNVPGLAGSLGGKVAGFGAGLGGWLGGEALMRAAFTPENAGSDDTNFTEMEARMAEGVPRSMNDREFIRLLQNRNMTRGDIINSLQQAGVDVGRFV